MSSDAEIKVEVEATIEAWRRELLRRGCIPSLLIGINLTDGPDWGQPAIWVNGLPEQAVIDVLEMLAEKIRAGLVDRDPEGWGRKNGDAQDARPAPGGRADR